MAWFAWTVVGAVWAVQYADTQAWLVVPAGAWAAAALAAWSVGGGRAGLLVLAAGWTLGRAGWMVEAQHPAALAGQDVVVTGRICDFARRDAEATRFVLEVEAPATGQAARLHLNWYAPAPAIVPGERWQLLVRLRPPRGLRNPGAFDFEQWLYTRRIGASGYVRHSALNRPLPAGAATCTVGRLRGALARRIGQALDGHPATPFVLGVVVGATQGLQEEDWELLRRTGTTHLLAISGLNIAMVAAPFVAAGPLLARLLPALAARPSAGLVLGLFAGAAYSALAGFALATVRALAMLALVTVLALRRRRSTGGDVLAAAALLMVVLDPAALVTVSFWLSFGAVAGLLLLAMRRPAGHACPAGRGTGIRVAAGELLAAQWLLGLVLAPLTLGWFQQLSLIAPLANLVAVPVFTLAIMPLALLGSVCLAILPPAGALLLGASADIATLLLAGLREAGGWSLATWRPPSTGWPELACAAAGAAVLCWPRPLPWRSCALVCFLPVIFGVARERPPLAVTVFDVGQGLAVLVETAEHALLYDTGPAFRQRDAGESVLVPALRRLGVARLDRLVVSHDDRDHSGGAASVLAAFPHARLVAPGPIAGLPAPAERCAAGVGWTWDGVQFHILAPPAGGSTDDNDGSCVLAVVAGGGRVLLTGDIGQARERALAGAGALAPVDLVLAPHHGSRSSSGPELVAATHPRFVVFAAGHRNRWGFPADEVAARWRAAGACLLETSAGGALRFVGGAGGGLALVHRERADAAHLWTAEVPRAAPCPP